ncbi:hypothetical protein OC846_002931 [Tilletia horrida]|uniref:Transmembrane protein n=1 Tax=Tilletia horrida TaxID=155126 RepID=A0AAN6GQD6_9BASI|nr:hypothetical protein OC846_002931 [Tilletia horrida]KAK0552992.1 hypothetical protein OC845_001411 [Tilletia horrida]KAK0566888.1 hypothetical protein OC861_003010 [Tilletia horrida]
MSTFLYSNVTAANIHAVLAYTYTDWWAVQAKAAGFAVPDEPRLSPKFQNVFWYLTPNEAYVYQIGLMYATLWLGAIGWDILSTLSFDVRLVRQTKWRSFPSTVHSLAYMFSRFGTLIWLVITVANLVTPSLHCQPTARAAYFAFAISIASTHLIFMMRTISIWNLNRHVIVSLLIVWLVILGGCIILGSTSQTTYIPGSYFCLGRNNKAFQISQNFVLAALGVFDLLCLGLTVAKLNKSGWRAIVQGFLPGQHAHYTAEDWAIMLVHRTIAYCFVQFALLGIFVILSIIPSLAPFRYMQVVATTTIGASMACRIFRHSWRLTRDPTLNKPPSYYDGWEEDHAHLDPSSGRPTNPMLSADGEGQLQDGPRLTLAPPVSMVAKPPTLRKSPMSGDDLYESYVEGEFKYIRPFHTTAVLGSLGALGRLGTITNEVESPIRLEQGTALSIRQEGGGDPGNEATPDPAAGHVTTEGGLTPAERYAALHSKPNGDEGAAPYVSEAAKAAMDQDVIEEETVQQLALTTAAGERDVTSALSNSSTVPRSFFASLSPEMLEVRSLHGLGSTFDLTSGLRMGLGSRWSLHGVSSSNPTGSGGLQNLHSETFHIGSSMIGKATALQQDNGGPKTGVVDNASLLRMDLGRRRTFPTLGLEAQQSSSAQAVTGKHLSDNDGGETGPTAPAANSPAVSGGIARSFDKSSFSPPSTAATSRPSTGTNAGPFGGNSDSRLSTPNRQIAPPWDAGPVLSPRQLEKRRSFLASPPLSTGPIPASSRASRRVYDFRLLKETSEMADDQTDASHDQLGGRVLTTSLGADTPRPDVSQHDPAATETAPEVWRPKTAPDAATRAADSANLRGGRSSYHRGSVSNLSAAYTPDPKIPTVMSSGESISESPTPFQMDQSGQEEEELDAQSAFRQVCDRDADARTLASTSSIAAAGVSSNGRPSQDTKELLESASNSPVPAEAEDDETDSVFAFSIHTHESAGLRQQTRASTRTESMRPQSAKTIDDPDDGRPRTSRGGPVHAFGSTEIPGTAAAAALTDPEGRARSGSIVGAGSSAARSSSTSFRPRSSAGYGGRNFDGARPGTAGRT